MEVESKLEFIRNSPYKTVIYGVSGSVATIKANEIAIMLLKNNFNVVLIPTPNSIHFLNMPDYNTIKLE